MGFSQRPKQIMLRVGMVAALWLPLACLAQAEPAVRAAVVAPHTNTLAEKTIVLAPEQPRIGLWQGLETLADPQGQLTTQSASRALDLGQGERLPHGEHAYGRWIPRIRIGRGLACITPLQRRQHGSSLLKCPRKMQYSCGKLQADRWMTSQKSKSNADNFFPFGVCG